MLRSAPGGTDTILEGIGASPIDRDRSIPVNVYKPYFTGDLKPGATVKVHWVAVVRDYADGGIIRYILDSSGKRHEYAYIESLASQVREKIVLNKPTKFSRDITIPKDISCGLAYYYSERFYWKNDLQRIHKIHDKTEPAEMFITGC